MGAIVDPPPGTRRTYPGVPRPLRERRHARRRRGPARRCAGVGDRHGRSRDPQPRDRR